MKKALILILILLCLAGNKLFAAPAYPNPVEVRQPDGTTLIIRVHGDEWFNYTTTEDGYMIVQNQQGFYVYATVSPLGVTQPTDIIARDVNARTAADVNFLQSLDVDSNLERLSKAANTMQVLQTVEKDELPPAKAYPVTGSPKALVILVNFADKSFVTSTPQSAFNNLCNQTNYSVNGATGSVKDWYKASSFGKLQLDFVVVGPYTLSKSMEYYGKYDTGTLPLPAGYGNAPGMVVEACALAKNAGVNFTQFDEDGDGEVDNVFIVYAGHNEAEGAGVNTIWPHRWAVQSNNYSGTNASRTFDGKLVRVYACTSELRGASGSTIAGIGTFVHEFGHVIGLPDYYHTTNQNITTFDSWSVMASGNYNNQSRTPPVLSAYDRFFLGWFTPEELTATAQKTLNPIAQVTSPPANTNQQAYLVAATNHNLNGKSPNPNEFFVFEYREKTGWDAYLPSAGMVIWHIDYNASAWSSNTVNNYTGPNQTLASHMRVFIEPVAAGSAYTSGAFYPKLWNGTDIQRPITNITKNGTTNMTFNITFPVAGDPVATAATTINSAGFTANWLPSAGASSYLLSVYYKNNTGTKIYTNGGAFFERSVGNVISYKVTNLDRDISTEWYYTLKAVSGGNTSGASNEITVKLTAFDPVTCEYLSNNQENRGVSNSWWGDANGYIAGTNAVGAAEFAEFYNYSQGAVRLSGIKMNIRVLGTIQSPANAKITLKVWRRGTGTLPLPGTEIYQQDVQFSSLKTGENKINFTSPVYVSGPFFIGYQVYNSTPRNDFDMCFTNLSSNVNDNTAYIKRTSWQPYGDVISGGQGNISLYLFPELCTFFPEWNGNENNIWDNPNNWLGGKIPGKMDKVTIPGNVNRFPDLSSVSQVSIPVAEIHFQPGAEIGKQSKLLPGKTYIQYDLSKRKSWNMLSIPLGEVYPADFVFAGNPLTWVRTFESNNNVIGGAAKGGWTTAANNNRDPFTFGQGFVIWLDPNTSTSRGLGYVGNSIHELPFFEYYESDDPEIRQRYETINSAHEYVDGWSTFYNFNPATGVKVSGESYNVERTNLAYKIAGPTVPLTADFFNGFALIGNPYMAALDFKDFFDANKTKINESYQIWIDGGLGDGSGSYGIYNSAAGGSAGAGNLNEFIAPLQGFIVERINSVSNNQLEITESMAKVNKNPVLRSSVSSVNSLNIDARNPIGVIRTLIAKRESGQDEFCNSDSRKIINNISDIPEIYTLKPFKGNLIAVGVNIINNDDLLIPLGLATAYTGNITLTFSGMDSYDANLTLIDILASREINLTGLASYDYTFNYTPKKLNGEPAVCEDRFFIRISKAVTGLKETLTANVNVYESKELIQVVSAASNPLKEISVYDMQGMLIYKVNANNAISHTIERNWPAGVYLVKVISEKTIDNVKLIIR